MGKKEEIIALFGEAAWEASAGGPEAVDGVVKNAVNKLKEIEESHTRVVGPDAKNTPTP